MNKSDLINHIADKSGLSKKDVGTAVNLLIDTVGESLKNGESIDITGFGSFKVSVRGERTGRNPSTGKEIKIPEKRVPQFKPGKTLKDIVAGG